MIEQFEMRIVLFLLFCVHLRPSADHLVNDVGLLYDPVEPCDNVQINPKDFLHWLR